MRSIYYLFDDLVFFNNRDRAEEGTEGRTDLSPPPPVVPPVVKKNCCREEIKSLFNFPLRWPVHQEEKGDRLVQ